MEAELSSHVSSNVQIGELKDCNDGIGKLDMPINWRGEDAVHREESCGEVGCNGRALSSERVRVSEIR